MNQELQYLRNELNQRITYSYERSHKVLGHLLLLWGGMLLLAAYKNLMDDIFLFFIVSTIFFISVIVIWIFSKRELENWKGVLKIAAYNTVFYEKIPCAKNENKFYWELATYKLMIKERRDEEKDKEKENSDKKPDYTGASDYTGTSNYTWSYDYFIFSLIATIMNSLLLLLLLFKFPETLCKCCSNTFQFFEFLCKVYSNIFNFSKILECISWQNILIIGLCFSYIVFSVILSIITHENTDFNPQKSFKERKEQMKSFIDDAIEIGYYAKSEIRERLGEVIWKEIKEEECKAKSPLNPTPQPPPPTTR